MEVPKGIVPAMLTVFNNDGSLDEGGTKAFAEWLIGCGVHGLAPCGSTGEGAAITEEERLRIIKATSAQAKGRVPVYAGVINYATEICIRMSKAAIDAGAEGVLVLLPYYYRPTIPSVINHLRKISAAIDRPIVLYNNPWFAGFELTPIQIKELADEGVVCSVKAAHGDPMRVNYLKYLCGDKVTALYGHDYAPMEAFFAGADGWLSGLPNLVPDFAVQLYEAIVIKKDMLLGQSIWKRIVPFAYYFMYERQGVNQSPHWLSVFKEALRMRGVECGKPRLPAEEMTNTEREVLKTYMTKMYPKE